MSDGRDSRAAKVANPVGCCAGPVQQLRGTRAGSRVGGAPDRMLAIPEARAALLRADHVVPHTDADGLAAGAIALRTRAEPAGSAVLFGRGETPWTSPLPPGMPALLDWGVRPYLVPRCRRPSCSRGRARA